MTFSPNCKRIVALTVDGRLHKLEEVPQDNTLYDTLTEHNVDIIILENLKQVCLSACPPLLLSLCVLCLVSKNNLLKHYMCFRTYSW